MYTEHDYDDGIIIIIYNLCTLQKMHFLVCQVDCLVASMLTVLHLEQKGKEILLQKGNDT